MTNKLVVIINSPKLPKIKKLLLYEMKFLVPNYSCLQNPWLGGATAPRSPFSLSITEFVEPPPPRTNFLGTPLVINVHTYSRKVSVISCQSLMKLGVSRQTSEKKCSNIKFHENLSSGSRVNRSMRAGRRWDQQPLFALLLTRLKMHIRLQELYPGRPTRWQSKATLLQYFSRSKR